MSKYMVSKTDKLYIEDKPAAVLDSKNIFVGFDLEALNYYAECNLIALGLGQNREEALEDLREAVHFGIDTLINMKLDDNKQ